MAAAAPVRRRVPGLTVTVSVHARERARSRFPGFKAARIVDEVHEALLDRRVSPHKPSWAETEHLRRSPGGLFVWTADLGRAHVIVLDRYTGEQTFVVVTTLTRTAPA